MKTEIIALASDHGGFKLKKTLNDLLQLDNFKTLDLGTHSSSAADYPDYGHLMAKVLNEKQASLGILICGSGIGMSIAANRFAGIRAALVHDTLGARLSREHNDANVLCLGERVLGIATAKECLNIFLNTKFQGGRHKTRINKIHTGSEP